MDCTSVAAKISGLWPRFPAGLRRPTREIPGLGTIVQVREERCHCWQLTHQFVSTRQTLIDEIVYDPSEANQAIEFMSWLVASERPLRERLIRAVYFQFAAPETKNVEFDVIVEHLNEWMVPYRINCTAAINSITVKYDCSDAPGRLLLGASQINVTLHRLGAISAYNFYRENIVDDLKIAAYRQRVVPENCGFVKDSIADQFAIASHIKPNEELASLLSESIEQTVRLHENAVNEHKPFLSQVVDVLFRRRAKYFEGAK